MTIILPTWLAVLLALLAIASTVAMLVVAFAVTGSVVYGIEEKRANTQWYREQRQRERAIGGGDE